MATENGWGAPAAQFRRDGFAVVDPFFAELEVAALQNALQELIEAGKLHSVATDFDRETRRRDDKINLQICPLYLSPPIFCRPTIS